MTVFIRNFYHAIVLVTPLLHCSLASSPLAVEAKDQADSVPSNIFEDVDCALELRQRDAAKKSLRSLLKEELEKGREEEFKNLQLQEKKLLAELDILRMEEKEQAKEITGLRTEVAELENANQRLWKLAFEADLDEDESAMATGAADSLRSRPGEGVHSKPTANSQPTASQEPKLKSGLVAQFWYLRAEDFSNSNFPALNGHRANLTRIDSEPKYLADQGVAWDGLKKSENFAARWSGFLHIDRPGTYTFALDADDGSVLFLDETQVNEERATEVRHMDVHRIDLKPGFHKIALKYFQRKNNSRLFWKYSGPDTEGKLVVVPKEKLSHSPGMLFAAIFGSPDHQRH